MENDFQRSTTTDHIAGRGGELLDTQWSEDSSKLAFISSSRDHKEAHLQIADSKTGNVSSIFKEDNSFLNSTSSTNFIVLFISEFLIKKSSGTLQSTSTIALPIPKIFIMVFL